VKYTLAAWQTSSEYEEGEKVELESLEMTAAAVADLFRRGYVQIIATAIDDEGHVAYQ
jgi:hypothetical protein